MAASVNAVPGGGAKMLPMKEALDLALGTPEVGCVDLVMLHACIRQLMMHCKAENVMVSVKDFGGITEGDPTLMSLAAKSSGIDITDVWQVIQLRSQVEGNRQGIDQLYDHLEKSGGLGGGGSNFVTWDRLGELLHGTTGGEDVDNALIGLDRAQKYMKDGAGYDQLERSKSKVLERVARRKTQSREGDSLIYGRKKKKKGQLRSIGENGKEADGDGDGSADADGSGDDASGESVAYLEEEEEEEEDEEGVRIRGSLNDIEKSIQNLGEMALLKGTNEARLDAMDELMQKMLKFKKTASHMLQDMPLNPGDLLNELKDRMGLINGNDVKQLNDLMSRLTETGGLKELQDLLKRMGGEDADARDKLAQIRESIRDLEESAMSGGLGAGGGAGVKMKQGLAAQAKKMGVVDRKIDRVSQDLKEAKNELQRLMGLIADIMSQNKDKEKTESDIQDMKELLSRLQEEIQRQNALLNGMADAETDVLKDIDMLKERTRQLQDWKADKNWVLKELANKADVESLENQVSKDHYMFALADVSQTLSDFFDRLKSLEEKCTKDLQELMDEIRGKMSSGDFEGFKDFLSAGLDQLRRRLDFIAGACSGEEDAAGLKLVKFHCISCDRPIHTVKQPPAPNVPAPEALNISKSARPFMIFEQAKIRKHNNRNDNNETTNVSNFTRTVADQKAGWERRRNQCLNRKYGRPDPLLADRKDIFDINSIGYYRTGLDLTRLDRTGPERTAGLDRTGHNRTAGPQDSGPWDQTAEPMDVVDVWKQPRKCGGEGTRANPWQRVRADGRVAKMESDRPLPVINDRPQGHHPTDRPQGHHPTDRPQGHHPTDRSLASLPVINVVENTNKNRTVEISESAVPPWMRGSSYEAADVASGLRCCSPVGAVAAVVALPQQLIE